MITVKDISERLSERVGEVVRVLLPRGKASGHEWCIGGLSGDPGHSLRVNIGKEKAGVWSDFATGDSGDLIDLWSRVKNISLTQAIQEAKAYLGIQSPQFEARQKTYRRPEKPNCNKDPGEQDPVWKYLTGDRCLSPDAIRAYRIASQDKRIVFPYLRNGQLIFVKYLGLQRVDGKKQVAVEQGCEPCLFGWQAIDERAREITICEGEIDAPTLWQYGHPALSVPFGAGEKGKHKWIETEFDNLDRFETIYLCFDQDIEGEKAAADIAERLGRFRCRVVTLPKKDPNECLQSGVTKEAIDECFRLAKTIDPDGLRGAETYLDEVMDEFYPKGGIVLGFSPPWEKTKGKINFRPSELSIWTGISGHGKTTLLNQIVLEALSKGERACIASLEIKPRKTLHRMTRQATTERLPEAIRIQDTHKWFTSKLWLFDFVGTAKSSWILEVFKYARHRYGITQFIVDSLMKCGLGEDDYNGQKDFVDKLSDFKNDHGVHVHLVAHPRKSDDEDGAPGKMDVKGTGAVTDLADNVFSIWRNKKKEIARTQALTEKTRAILQSPDAFFGCEKQRNGEWEGRIPLWWNPNAYQYVDSEQSLPIDYVKVDEREVGEDSL